MLSRANITDAIRFWEIARLPYNLVLALIVLVAAFATGEHWQGWLGMAPALVFLAVIANVLYCAAYPIDLFVQASDFRESRRIWRWVLWSLGTLIAAVFAAATLFGLGGLATNAG